MDLFYLEDRKRCHFFRSFRSGVGLFHASAGIIQCLMGMLLVTGPTLNSTIGLGVASGIMNIPLGCSIISLVAARAAESHPRMYLFQSRVLLALLLHSVVFNGLCFFVIKAEDEFRILPDYPAASSQDQATKWDLALKYIQVGSASISLLLPLFALVSVLSLLPGYLRHSRIYSRSKSSINNEGNLEASRSKFYDWVFHTPNAQLRDPHPPPGNLSIHPDPQHTRTEPTSKRPHPPQVTTFTASLPRRKRAETWTIGDSSIERARPDLPSKASSTSFHYLSSWDTSTFSTVHTSTADNTFDREVIQVLDGSPFNISLSEDHDTETASTTLRVKAEVLEGEQSEGQNVVAEFVNPCTDFVSGVLQEKKPLVKSWTVDFEGNTKYLKPTVKIGNRTSCPESSETAHPWDGSHQLKRWPVGRCKDVSDAILMDGDTLVNLTNLELLARQWRTSATLRKIWQSNEERAHTTKPSEPSTSTANI